VIRGGSYDLLSNEARTTARSYSREDNVSENVGFRIARDAE